MGGSLRYLGSAAGFGFGLVWMTVGLGSAIVCLLLAALGYCAVFMAERAQAEASTRRPPIQTPEAHLLAPERVERDRDLSDDATTPLAAEAEYGWPWPRSEHPTAQ